MLTHQQNISGLSLRDLEYVVAIADHGSFVKASDACGVAQPSLSSQVRKLEAWIGLTIFERTTRRVMITKDGERFIEQARRVLTEARALLTTANPIDSPFGGSLRVSAIETLGPYLFPRILGPLKQQYPEVQFSLGEGLEADLNDRLIRGELDAAFVSLPQQGNLATAALFREPFLLAYPESYRTRDDALLNWEALPDSERLLLDDGHCLRDQALVASPSSATASRHATSLETLKYMVAAGEGSTLIPALARTDVSFIVYKSIPDERYSRRIGLVWRRSDPRALHFKELGSFLQKVIINLDYTLQPL